MLHTRTASRSRGWLLLRVACTSILLASACGGTDGDTKTSGTSSGAPEGSEARVAAYGLAPLVDASVTYQPDVVIVGGGADSIRSASSDGLTWTIDGNATHAGDLEPGKVMFLTGKAVGRIVAIEEHGDDLVVTLGPIDLTDVVRDGHFETEQDIDLGALALQTLPDLPGSLELTEKEVPPPPEDSTTTSESALGVVSLPMAPIASISAPTDTWPPPTSGNGAELTLGDFSVELTRTSGAAGRVGLKVTYSKNGVAFAIDFGAIFNEPAVVAEFDIRSGKIVSGTARITGLNKLEVKVDAGSETGLAGNFKARVEVPIDANFPFLLGPVPMNLSIRQKFIVETAFSAKNSTLSATGSYKVDGPLGFDYGSGGLQLTTPTVTEEGSMIDSLDGVSVGVNGVIVAYQAKVLLGLGVPLLTAGPFGAITVSTGLTNGSDLGIVKCKQASLDVVVGGGLGFTIGGGDTGKNYLQSLFDRLRGSAPVKLDTEYANKSATVVHEVFIKPPVAACGYSGGG